MIYPISYILQRFADFPVRNKKKQSTPGTAVPTVYSEYVLPDAGGSEHQLFSGRSWRTTSAVRHISLSRSAASSFSSPTR